MKRLMFIIAVACAAVLIGCTPPPPRAVANVAPSPSPSPSPSPTPTPAGMSTLDKGYLGSQYELLAKNSVAKIEKDMLLLGTQLPEVVCDLEDAYFKALDIEEQVKDKGPKGDDARAIVTIEQAKKLVDGQLATFATFAIRAAKTPGLDLSCYRGEGRAGTAAEVLHDLVYRYEERDMPLAATGMTLPALRALALARDKELVTPIRLALTDPDKLAGNGGTLAKLERITPDKARYDWAVYENPWGFTPAELGFAPEQAARLQNRSGD